MPPRSRGPVMPRHDEREALRLATAVPGSQEAADMQEAPPMTAEPPDMPGGLSRSDPSGPGMCRRRCGRGIRYFSPSSEPVTDAEIVARIQALVIPPAWEQVWICPDPAGHIQA